MSNNRLLIYLVSFVGIWMLFLLDSCSGNDRELIDPARHPHLVDQSWLIGQPCSVPCWQGLELGSSSRQNSIEVVKDLSFIYPEGVETNSRWVNYSCKQPPESTCVSMEFDNDILNKIMLAINYRITIEQIADKLGSPDGFYFTITNPDDWTSCDIMILWIEKQIEITVMYRGHQPLCETFFKTNGKIPKNLQANHITLMQPGEVEDTIESLKEPDVTGVVYMRWTGFSE
jgi:hypothetical protein